MNPSKTTICNIRNNKPKIIKDDSRRKLLINRIHDIFIEHNSNIGRKRIHELCLKNLNIRFQIDKLAMLWMKIIDFATLKNLKIKENKHLNARINDLVLKDFNNKRHEEEILATDVTYIPSTYDCL